MTTNTVEQTRLIAQVQEMISQLGMSCTEEQAFEALRQHRGNGIPSNAVSWLVTEDGFSVLKRLQASYHCSVNPSTNILEQPESGIDNAGLGTNKAEGWTCVTCFRLNPLTNAMESCDGCGQSGPLAARRLQYEEELSCIALRAEQENRKFRWLGLDRVAPPNNWDTFPLGENQILVELKGKSGALKGEYQRILDLFIKGGISPSEVISLKRIQNLSLWQRYAAQRDMVASKDVNKGDPNEQFVFHGSKSTTNTTSILTTGFLGQYGCSKPFGTWTHTSSSYSGGSFAEVLPDGSRRIFICRAAIGTPGIDDGTGEFYLLIKMAKYEVKMSRNI